MESFWTSAPADRVNPFASSGPGTEYVAAVRGKKFVGIALMNASDGTVLNQIRAFPPVHRKNGEDPQATGNYDRQAFGAFDGRYAVWAEYPTPYAATSIWEWDRVTGQVKRLASASGEIYSDPMLGDGYAAWVASTGLLGDKASLFVLKLKTGKQYVATRGYINLKAVAGGAVFWDQRSRPKGGTTVVKALDLKSRQPRQVPPAVLQTAGLGPVESSGDSWAWTGWVKHRATLYYSPDGQRVEVVAQTSGFSPPLALVGVILAAPQSAGGLILANTDTGAYSIVPEASWATELSDGLLVEPGSSGQKAEPTSLVPVPVLAADLAGMTCNG